MKSHIAISALLLFWCTGTIALAQDAKKDSVFMRNNYDKFEYQIPMRDGVKLFAVVYVPKEKSKKYPILLNRTCYNASDYGDFKRISHLDIWYGTRHWFSKMCGRYMLHVLR